MPSVGGAGGPIAAAHPRMTLECPSELRPRPSVCSTLGESRRGSPVTLTSPIREGPSVGQSSEVQGWRGLGDLEPSRSLCSPALPQQRVTANRLSDPRHLPQGSVLTGKWERMLGRHPPLAPPRPPAAEFPSHQGQGGNGSCCSRPASTWHIEPLGLSGSSRQISS